jgi:hypothetical protein
MKNSIPSHGKASWRWVSTYRNCDCDPRMKKKEKKIRIWTCDEIQKAQF